MPNISDQQYQQLLDSLIGQAKYFLEEAGEFYPYGSVLDVDMQVRPVGFYSENEYPESNEVLKQLETAIKDGLKNGKYLLAMIGVDVMIPAPARGITEKRSALQIRIYRDSEDVTIMYSIYEQTADGFVFSELLEL